MEERFVLDNNDNVIDFKDKSDKYCLSQEDVRDLLNKQQKQIAELEKELTELKEKAIIPRFRIGQECYLIDNNFNYFKNIKESNIVRSNIGKIQNWYYVKDYGVYHEEELFATEQEAQAKLKEI